MGITRSQTQLSNTSRMNLLVVLLMLFVVSAHCSTAMAFAPGMAENVELASITGHCGEMPADVDDSPTNGGYCDDGCSSPLTSLQSQTSNQSKDSQADIPLLVAIDHELPLARAGPCRIEPRALSADFTPPPLYYSLCVLRL